MFGKMTLVLEKSSLIGIFGLIFAIGALILAYTAVGALVLGHGAQVRRKAAFLFLLAIPLLFVGITVMLKSEQTTGMFIKLIEQVIMY